MTPLTEVDRDALTRALAECRAESPGRAAQIAAKLKDESWESVARFAAYYCQTQNLHLTPWEVPPIRIRDIEAALTAPDDARRTREAARLLQRMQRCGLSIYEPDPVVACEAVEAQQRQTVR